jgi:biopolymer transport protein ExbD
MAEMNIADGNSHKGKVRMKKASLRVDLTPLVDLAFLLIAFFMLTTTLLDQRAIKLVEPKEGGPQSPVSECQVLNLLTDSLGHTYYWEGLDCKSVTPISMTGEHSLHDKLKEKQTYLNTHCLHPSGKAQELICLIKLLPGSQYENMISVLDEVVADKVPVYAIQNYSDDEAIAVRRAQQQTAMQ